jgi:MYXO-CTERM domain-containing protein
MEASAIHATRGGFEARLPGVGLVGSFDEEGVSFAGDDGEPALGLRLAAFGRAGEAAAVDPVTPAFGACGPDLDPTGACLPRLEYDHGALIAWWLGRTDGVEQGWTLATPPAGEGLVAFEVEVDGALGADADALAVTDASGRTWRVSEVTAWDARGRDLPADAHVDGDTLVVEVDDSGAVYPITVDPTYTTAGWDLVGDDGRFGFAVAGAGDVDGDGYDDVIVGAYGVGLDTGRAYLYRGGASGLATTAAATLEGEAAGDEFGYAVAGAGDVDGDGYADVVVGAQMHGGVGRAYVFRGGATGLSTTAATTLDGTGADGGFGYAVAGAGDVDGDGYDDVLVADKRHGVVYLHAGSASGVATTASATLAAPDVDSEFGQDVAGAGDVDGDGHDDVIVGAPYYSSYTGRAYVYAGGAGGLATTPAATLTGSSSGGYFGFAVDGAGDVDADGFADVIVGSFMASSRRGRAFLYAGSASGVATVATATLAGSASYDELGADVAGLGDVDGDGYDDVGVTRSNDSEMSVYRGTAAGLDSVASATLSGGWDVAAAGDVDGDGYPDVLVGGAVDAAYVYAGGSAGVPATAASTLDSPVPYVDHPVVASVGDLDGDGYGDFAVASSGYTADASLVYVFRGGAAGPAEEADGTIFAGNGLRSIAAAGDVNGDGFGDVLVGSGSDSHYVGRFELFLGDGITVSSTPAVTFAGTTSFEYLAYALAAMGDVDGDGYDDVLVSAHGAGVGEVDLYRGTATGIEATPSTTLSGALEGLGGTLAVGDFDADGFADVAAGSWIYGLETGGVATYHGSASGLATSATRTLVGESEGDFFGCALAAGDFDGDGYDDLAVGASYHDMGNGRVYVYAGGLTGITAVPDVTLDGAAGAWLGSALAAVGDVNADGYADLLVMGGGFAGLFEGSAAGLATTPTTTFADVAGLSGVSAFAGAGDVDGDGFDDVLLGGSVDAALYYGYATDVDGDGADEREDCDDADASVHPGAAETCDGLDDDCDGATDEPDASDAATWYADADGDGFGDAGATTTGCEAPSGYVADATDCDDRDAGAHPGAAEAWYDGVDQDCDGNDDDLDGDGLPAADDCDDTDPDATCDTGTPAPAVEDPDDEDEGASCGCSSGATGAPWLALLVAAAVSRRRRPA